MKMKIVQSRDFGPGIGSPPVGAIVEVEDEKAAMQFESQGFMVRDKSKTMVEETTAKKVTAKPESSDGV